MEEILLKYCKEAEDIKDANSFVFDNVILMLSPNHSEVRITIYGSPFMVSIISCPEKLELFLYSVSDKTMDEFLAIDNRQINNHPSGKTKEK